MPESVDLSEQIEAYENFNPAITVTYKGIPLVYRIPNRTALWRVETLPTKEPSTIAWLESMEPGSILLDVGANIGMYTIFAAKLRQATVYAFEPESQNYALLNANIHANGLGSQVTAYCAGLSDHQGLDKLYLSEFALGSSCHSLGEAVGFDLKPRTTPYTQGAISYSLDAMVREGMLPVPNYIKIDVDGFEHKVLLGALETLAHPDVKSIIIELNPAIPQHRDVVKLLNQLGFQHNQTQVNFAARKTGAFAGVGEWIFARRNAAERVTHITIPAVISQSEQSRTFALTLLEKLKHAEIITDPFPHAVIRDVFPADYYEQIQHFFPLDEQMIPIGETGRTGKPYRERLVTLFDEAGFSRLSAEQRQFWGALGGWLYSPEFINGVITCFLPYVEERLNEVSQLLGWTRIHGDALLVSDQTNFGIGPHTDAAHRLVTFLFYLPQDERFKDFGTSIYAPKNPEFACMGGHHYPYDQFNHQKIIPFLPNTLLMFPRSKQSFHGVEPIHNQDITRHLLINNIRLADA